MHGRTLLLMMMMITSGNGESSSSNRNSLVRKLENSLVSKLLLLLRCLTFCRG